MLPFVLAAGLAWLLPEGLRVLLTAVTVTWGGAILCFLAGVRRGLSFRTAGGARVAEIGSMLWVFVLAAGALFSPSLALSVGLLILGFGSVGVLDHLAAGRGEAPPFFGEMRPVQMAVPVVCLLELAALVWG